VKQVQKPNTVKASNHRKALSMIGTN